MSKYFIFLALASLAILNSSAQTTATEWFEKGKSLKKDENYKEAIIAYNKAIALKPNYPDALHELGWCYNEESLYDKAVEVLKKEEKAGPTDKTANYFELGYAYKALKNYTNALAYFNKAIASDSKYDLAYKERGYTYYKMKEYEKALEDFDTYDIQSLAGGDADFYYTKGWIENDLEKYKDAVSSLSFAAKLDKTYANAFNELGYAHYKLNAGDDALANYRIGQTLDIKDYHPVIGMADVYYEIFKNYDSAIYFYQKGIPLLTKSNKLPYYRLGWCYNDKNLFSEAVTPLKQAVAIDPQYDDARTELGYAYYKLKQYDDALNQFRSVMTHDSKHTLSRYYAGFCYYLKNDQASLQKMINELKALNSTKYVETLTKYIK